MPLTSQSFDELYYLQHREAGLDYLGFGTWHADYADWLADVMVWRGRRVLDVGCACGAIMRGFGDAGVIVQGVDVNEYAVNLGRKTWPDMAPLIHTCDAANLHIFADQEWQGIHCAQVAEHWKPHLVPIILRELWRVCAPGSLMWCCLDTSELYARQKRDASSQDEDATHFCLKPIAWWHQECEKAGWQIVSSQYDQRLERHPKSYLKRYDWDWFIAVRQ